MAERERRMTRPYGGVFVARAEVMSADEIDRALRRMAHEIIERNRGLDNIVLVGLQTGGVMIARALVEVLAEIGGPDAPDGLAGPIGAEPDDISEELAEGGGPDVPVALGTLDVALYRDDIGIRPVLPEEVTEIPVDLDGRDVVLVDDVASTGRTLEAAARSMANRGARRIAAVVTHGLFLEDAEGRLQRAGVSHVWSSDSVPHPTNAIHLAPLLAGALRRRGP
jgi:pyrimidine operon attenuation protein/uracil phosphoribosyltransferase